MEEDSSTYLTELPWELIKIKGVKNLEEFTIIIVVSVIINVTPHSKRPKGSLPTGECGPGMFFVRKWNLRDREAQRRPKASGATCLGAAQPQVSEKQQRDKVAESATKQQQ